MPKVLPIFPLYPSPSFLQYNVSFGIPGPKLWDLPLIGDFAKKSNFPNTQSSILIPDIEYIKRFANYELGISDAMLKAAQAQNIAKIKDPQVRKQFDKMFGSSTDKTGAFRDGIGLSSVEKTILASVFESQKPYFEIAQFVIKSVAKIEDIVARITPLIGAAINPPLALAIKSRKPKGNGPQSNKFLTPYGTPVAIGYKNGEQIKKGLDQLKTELQRGNGVSIDKNGNYTKVLKNTGTQSENKGIELNDSNLMFTYATISTFYSTGMFIPEENYIYKYIDLPADEKLPPIVTPDEKEEPDLKPDRIIFGIFNKNGTAIDPNSKIKYWGPNSTGTDLTIQESIFESAPWIKNEKWIFDKSIDYSGSLSWQTLEVENYRWRKNGEVRVQKDSPGDGWEKLRYKDVIDFNKEEFQYLKYKEDDFITEFNISTITDYRRYYDYLVDKSLIKYNVPGDERAEIISQVEKLFSENSPNDKILEQLQNLIKFGDFKNSYVLGIDKNDWKKYSRSNPPTDSMPDPIRKIFKPMRFKIGNETVWIDPESEYDLKVVRVDPVLKIDYTENKSELVNSLKKKVGEDNIRKNIGKNTLKKSLSSEDGIKDANELLQKNSNIRNYIKNKVQINVIDKLSGNRSNFCLKIYRTTNSLYEESDTEETYRNIDTFDITNWNVNIDNQTGTKEIDERGISLKLYFEPESYPESFENVLNKEWSGGTQYQPDSNYSSSSNSDFIATTNLSDTLKTFINIANSVEQSRFSDIMNQWGLDWTVDEFKSVTDNLEWVLEKIDEIGNVSLNSESIDKTDIAQLIAKVGSIMQYKNVEYSYVSRQVVKPFIVGSALVLLLEAVVLYGSGSLAAISLQPILAASLFVKAFDKMRDSIEKFKDAIYDYKFYRKSVLDSSETTIGSFYKEFTGNGLGRWNLKLINGTVKEIIFYKGVISKDSIVYNGYIIDPNVSTVSSNTINSSSGKVLPIFGKSNIIDFVVGESPFFGIGFNSLNTQKSSVSLQISDLERFQISVFDSGSKLKSISSKNYAEKSILNKKIQALGNQNLSYSKGRYGPGWQGGISKDKDGKPVLNDDGTPFVEPDNPQFVGYLRRSQLTELDIEPYYIIEGYKRTKNDESVNTPSGANSSNGPNGGVGITGGSAGGGGFYRMPDAIGIIKVMIDLIVELGVKLFPAINKLIALIKNPANFIIEIIKSKVEDHFLIFSPKVTQIMQKVSNYSTQIKSIKDPDSKYFKIKEMREYVKSTEIANYLYVDDKGDFKFVIDGPALIGFFGILFGIDLNLSKAFNGGVPIKPIFSAPKPGSFDDFVNKFGIKKPGNNLDNQLEEKLIKNLDLTKPDEVQKNKIVSKSGEATDSNGNNIGNNNLGGKEYYEEVEITYSTGRFIKGVDYKYIYLDQKIESLIREADELINEDVQINYSGTASNPMDALQLASEKYQEAYDLIDKNDNSKDSLKKLLIEKIKLLKSKINIVSQPLFKFILGIVTLPLKVVFSIIKWLIDFFKKLTNPIKFPGLMIEFLSFQWIMQFFTPKGLLEIAGIKFKPEKLIEWCVAVNVKNPLFGKVPGTTEYLIPDDYVIADLNEFLSVGFEVKLPIYTAKQYRDLCLRPFRLFNVFFCLIEKIINSFIMLIWSVMGITAVIPPPLLKLCKRTPDENLSPNDIKDLRDLVSGLYKDDDLNVADPKLTTEQLNQVPTGGYDFIYEVKLPDGTVKKDLNRDAVQNIIDNNKNLNFDFLNFETL